MPSPRRTITERERRIAERERLYAAILGFAAQRGEGVPIRSDELRAFGPAARINRALAMLVLNGRLVRVGRGLYARPIATRLGKAPPPLDQLVLAVAQQRDERVAPHGAAAVHTLGLTRQAPAQTIYLTSGRSRRMTIGDQRVEFQHAPAWQLDIPVRRAGNVIRALAWLGPEKAGDAIRILGQRLPPVAIEELAAANRGLPEWLTAIVNRLVDTLRRSAAARGRSPL